MPTPPFKAPPGYRWIYTPYFRHWRTGRRVYRKNGGMFRFLVRTHR
jgi:hypothetical protein